MVHPKRPKPPRTFCLNWWPINSMAKHFRRPTGCEVVYGSHVSCIPMFVAEIQMLVHSFHSNLILIFFAFCLFVKLSTQNIVLSENRVPPSPMVRNARYTQIFFFFISLYHHDIPIIVPLCIIHLYNYDDPHYHSQMILFPNSSHCYSGNLKTPQNLKTLISFPYQMIYWLNFQSGNCHFDVYPIIPLHFR